MLARNRHSSNSATPAHNAGKAQQQQLSPLPSKKNDQKYSKKGGPTTLVGRLKYWCWMSCGAICSFFIMDYITNALFSGGSSSTSTTAQQQQQLLVLATATGNTGRTMPSTRTSLMDGILTPIRPISVSSPAREEYSFDNTAHIQPDPQQHAILIPYRERPFHLNLFLEYMGPYLHHHFPNADFTLWIIEQDDSELFNRAWLANVGLREIVKQAPETSCVIFHDVDLVPNMTSHVPYTTCQLPVQLGSELQHFNWTVPYPAYCGGITTMSLKHWQLINGLGNDFIGWGGEDDDLYHRLRQNGLLYQSVKFKSQAPTPHRPPKGQGVFRTISQKAEHHEQKKSHNQYWKTLELLKEMHENSDRWKFDGMSDAYYTITGSKSTEPGLGFAKYNHIKAIPQKSMDGVIKYHKNTEGIPDTSKPIAPLEFVHVPYTGGQAITKAASAANIVWGACHYGQFPEWNCPAQGSADFQYAPIQFMASYFQAQKPWQIPLMRFAENPMEGTKRFAVVRHPYSRAISFYRCSYDSQYGYPHGFKYHEIVENKNHPTLAVAEYLREREHPDKLNAFLQDFLIRANHPHKQDAIELTPQVNFVYYRGLKYVHHVLHYEFLQRDMKSLLEKYEMTGLIDIPPPERKRKRKKQIVKTYSQKRVPRVTWTWKSLLLPMYSIFRVADNKPPVVDMSLSDIEDEYLLGAQDLANETIAMLNSHFELDFRKFHYAKIKVVNQTSDQFWLPSQIIPKDSAVAKQQADRNNQLNNAKGISGGPKGIGGGAKPAAAATTVAAAAAKQRAAAEDPPKPAESQAQRLQELSEAINKDKKNEEHKEVSDGNKKGHGEKQEEEKKGGNELDTSSGNGNEKLSFNQRKTDVMKHLQERRKREHVDLPSLVDRNMRQKAEDLQKTDTF